VSDEQMDPAAAGLRHPCFPNPTIAEALCEIHFVRPPESAWDEAFFGDLFRRVQEDFPRMEPHPEVALETNRSPEGLVVRMAPVTLRCVYHHRDRSRMLQLTRQLVATNQLAPYAGWRRFRADVDAGWRNVREVVGATGIARVGLRYFNVFPRGSDEERVGEWLARSDLYPERLRGESAGFTFRFEHRLSAGRRLVVTVGERKGTGAPSAVILDIDHIQEVREPFQVDALAAELETAHDAIWKVFSLSLTDRARRYLVGGEK